MKIVFPYEEKHSPLFHKIKRPIVEVNFWSKLINPNFDKERGWGGIFSAPYQRRSII